jgi:hypothetical protein
LVAGCAGGAAAEKAAAARAGSGSASGGRPARRDGGTPGLLPPGGSGIVLVNSEGPEPGPAPGRPGFAGAPLCGTRRGNGVDAGGAVAEALAAG